MSINQESSLKEFPAPPGRAVSWQVSSTLKPVNARDFILRLQEIEPPVPHPAVPAFAASDLLLLGKVLLKVAAWIGALGAIGVFFWLLDMLWP